MGIDDKYGKNAMEIRDLVRFVAGSGLLIAAVVGHVSGSAGIALVSNIVLAAAVIVLAFGFRGQGSVVEGRAMGRFALATFGVSQLFGAALALGPESWFDVRVGLGSSLAIVNSLVGLVCLAFGALAMLRSHIVSDILSWPLLLLASSGAIIGLVVLVPTWNDELQGADPTWLLLIGALSSLVTLSVPVLLGLSALLASLPRNRRNP